MGTQQSPPFLRRQLGRMWQKLRKQAGLTYEDVNRRLEISVGRLSRLESGETAPDIVLARSLLDLYCIPVNDWEPVLEQVREARKKGWWQAHGLAALGFVALETAASSIRTFTLAFVPGIMQTERYARAVYQASLLRRTPADIDNEIAVRLIRQKRLTSEDDRLEVAAIIDETALSRPVGGSEVMGEQLQRIAELSELPNVTVQVLPKEVGANLGMMGAFMVLEFADVPDGDILYIEHVVGALNAEKHEQVRFARLTFERLRTEALNPVESLALLERAAQDL